MKKHLPYLIPAFFHLAFGIAIIIFSSDSFEKSYIFFGVILILSSIPYLFAIIRVDLEQRFFKIIFFINGLALIPLGILCFFEDTVDIDLVFMAWGVLDILHGLLEIAEGTADLRHRKDRFGIISLITGIVEIIFGVLLIIHLSEGVKVHMIVVGSILIFTAIKLTVLSFVKKPQVEENEKIE